MDKIKKLYSLFRKKFKKDSPKDNEPVKYKALNLFEHTTRQEFSVSVATFLDTPPSWVLRGPVYLVFVIVIGAIIYSTIVQVDDTVSSPLIVRGEEYVVQAPFSGIVSSLGINENDIVTFNDEILSIYSPNINVTGLEKKDLTDKRDEIIKKIIKLGDFIRQTKGIGEYYGKKDKRFSVPIPGEVIAELNDFSFDSSAYDVSQYNGLNEYRLMVSDLKVRANNLLNEVRKSDILLSKRAKIYNENKTLLNQGIISSPDLMNSEREYYSVSSTIDNYVSSFKSDILNALKQMSSLRQSLATQLSDYNLQIKNVNSRTEGVEITQSQAIVKAQFPGVVSQLFVKSSQMINQGEVVCRIIRNDFPRYGMIYIENKDISKVKVGQPVFVKFHAFPYQEYGVQEGQLVSLAKDTKLVEGLGYVYEAQVGFTKKNPRINLIYGANGLAEVVVGKKRIIELVFAPIGKFFDYLSGEDERK
ncbi:MAG: HlyD family efflux transporter periplasmic adaptor subunit [Ignavibacteria bacterium]|jgi:multidrug resistance efflux pump|nr:HlyD family efflux transporter periplasmic adaptor subunit [Ignavibacteria bacterium]MCU7502882.1 HlyD family efflux transporter periplasmic adaptor subunit [Ignavibacteria bacterium]MCU7515624.1 HlyD family efflux transporter periplasmic adaptor subunit [Ignavibacteria bacterium]